MTLDESVLTGKCWRCGELKEERTVLLAQLEAAEEQALDWRAKHAKVVGQREAAEGKLERVIERAHEKGSCPMC